MPLDPSPGAYTPTSSNPGVSTTSASTPASPGGARSQSHICEYAYAYGYVVVIVGPVERSFPCDTETVVCTEWGDAPSTTGPAPLPISFQEQTGPETNAEKLSESTPSPSCNNEAPFLHSTSPGLPPSPEPAAEPGRVADVDTTSMNPVPSDALLAATDTSFFFPQTIQWLGMGTGTGVERADSPVQAITDQISAGKDKDNANGIDDANPGTYFEVNKSRSEVVEIQKEQGSACASSDTNTLQETPSRPHGHETGLDTS
ncbi:hypothetical protein K435DRAFT_878480 [Dendrothele bispora CBS 962.96]|uniref:Uncharacterized protein n=1 Tax=Dendrothele bispora (strain CBS 962.96) TaxID=1314807 RepID=A0A4S8KMU7_DENBC|nr:hypothetical protein K435DRAFT_878480 [Dendrothele bispora CBS 962.96]